MSQALYRRYRPETFAEVIGQEHVTIPLMQALRTGRVSHAYLFSGPRGCGKTSSARILARCLNCAQGPTDTPCGVCDSCRELGRAGGGSLDVVEIDAASHNGVDDARDLRERAAFAPTRDRFKVFILDEAHMVTTQGFNALLKIVEEPPAHIKFLFATTEPEKVIGTIRSRTHHYPFRLVPPGVMTDYMAQLCQAEEISCDDGVLPLVVRAGGGSVRDTESVLDQLMAGAQAGKLTYQRAIALLGYTPASLLDGMVGALAARDTGAAFRVIESVVEAGQDPRRFTEDFLERLRDLIVVAAAGDAATAALRTQPADLVRALGEQADAIGLASLSRAADAVNAALTAMTGATSPRLQLELLAARMVDQVTGPSRPAQAADDAAQVAVRPAPHASAAQAGSAPARPGSASSAPASSDPAWVRPGVGLPTFALAAGGQSDDQADADDASTTSPTLATPASRPEPEPAASLEIADDGAASEAVDTRMVRQQWEQVLERLSSLRKFTWALVSQNARLEHVDGQRLLLAFPSDGLANTFQSGGHHELTAQAVADVIGVKLQIETVIIPGEPIAPAAGRPAPSRGGEPASSDEAARLAAGSWDSPATPSSRNGPAASGKAGPHRPSGLAKPGDPASAALADPGAIDEDLPAADDVDAVEAGLVGAPLVAHLLGGEVIAEIVDDTPGG